MNPKAESGKNRNLSNHTLHVQLGSICCAVKCHNEELLDRLTHLYSDFPALQEPDITLEVKTVENMSLTEFETALPKLTFSHDGDFFTTTHSLASGKRNLNAGTVSIEAETLFLDHDSGRGYINEALCAVYFTACKLKYNGVPPAFIVHSCGILHHDQVLLFAGPSGTGKSTVARFCDMEYGQVLNDEALLLYRPHRDSNTLMVEGIPIIGELPKRLNITAPLRVVLLLKQGRNTSLRRLDRMEAYVRFMRQIANPAFIGQMDKRAVYSLITDFSSEVTEITPFYELEFTLDQISLLEVLKELEASLDKEGRNDGKPDNQG